MSGSSLAAGLFASILLLNRYLRPPVVSTIDILPGLQAAAVTSVQVIPAGALEIRADRTNGSWLLAKPISYPAQSAAVEALLDALQNLVPATRITAGELREHRSADADFGFDPPANFRWRSRPATSAGNCRSATRPRPATRFFCGSSAWTARL